jgi:hypothetical protein
VGGRRRTGGESARTQNLDVVVVFGGGGGRIVLSCGRERCRDVGSFNLLVVVVGFESVSVDIRELVVVGAVAVV